MDARLASSQAVPEGGGSEALVRLLRLPTAYPEPTQTVEIRETHISWVFLTDHFAYKLKKPVRFDFLDFSDAPARRAACEAEVRLNRRLTRDVYLGVMPVTLDANGHLALAGAGTPIDWVVKMRRLPDDRTLDHLIRAHALEGGDVERLARRLADFYQQASPLTICAQDYRAALERHILANLEVLLSAPMWLSSALARRVHGAQLRTLALAAGLFEARVCDGRIIDGHGDLRPEHICLTDDVQIFDCLEFSAELRAIDVADELCFLAMECEFLGAEDVGRRVLEAYNRSSGDRPPLRLLSFYRSYRAAVRAKVTLLRAKQLAGAAAEQALRTAQEYLWLADRYTPGQGPALLLVVRGLVGTGKSTLAAELARRLGAELLQTDAVRREMFGYAERTAEFGQGLYTPQRRQQVYDEILERAGHALADRLSVVVDGTYLAVGGRSALVTLAKRRGALPLVINCRCDEAVAQERIAQRLRRKEGLSDARPELYTLQRTLEEASPADFPEIEVDTTSPPPAQVESVIEEVRGREQEFDRRGAGAP